MNMRDHPTLDLDTNHRIGKCRPLLSYNSQL
jgi:hypothetical protein